MKRISKILFLVSIVLIIFWLLSGVILKLLPLEFVNRKTKISFYAFCLYGFPCGVIFMLLYTIKRSERIKSIIYKLIMILLLSAFSFFILLFLGLSCDWSTTKVFFKNKKNPTTLIVKRSHDCGIYDSNKPDTIFKTRVVFNYLIWATKIDTINLDRNKWIPVKE